MSVVGQPVRPASNSCQLSVEPPVGRPAGQQQPAVDTGDSPLRWQTHLAPPTDHHGAQCASDGDQPVAAKKDQRKLGGSFLSRARNSTMNLASLATVTQRFNCSASVGNLWPLNGPAGSANSSGSLASPSQRSELAQLSGDSQNVRPIDYVVRGTFDDYDYQSDSNNNTNTNNSSTNNNNSLLAKSDQPSQLGSSRSSKEKKSKRHKDMEKIEKLRLLVSYLRSGSGQNLPHPVELEADELELAQRYKRHLILCEDCLKVAEQEQQRREGEGYLSLGLMPTSSTPAMLALAGQTRSPPADRSAGSSDTLPTSHCESSQSVPKMFYIDDMERKNSDSSDTNKSQLAVGQPQSASLSDCGNHDHHHDDDGDDEDDTSGAQGGQYALRTRCRSAKAPISSSEATARGLPPRSWSSELFLSSTPTTTTKTTSATTSNTTTVPKISSTPTSDVQLAGSNNNTHLSGETDHSMLMFASSASHRSGAWTTPQNLASWIDNEVNSLVNDLETESQLVKSEKLAKSSKRKWLTGNPIRRNSSGSRST